MAIALQTVTWDFRRGARGRPKAPWRCVSDVASFAYLVRITKKYEVETFKFLKCIHSAWVKGDSFCDEELLNIGACLRTYFDDLLMLEYSAGFLKDFL
jgi:hypothetical protein